MSPQDANLYNASSYIEQQQTYGDTIVFKIIFLPLICCGLASNLLVFSAIVSSKKLRGVFNSLLLNLSMADFSSALTLALVYVSFMLSSRQNDQYAVVTCKNLFVSSSVFSSASVLTLSVMSFERRSAILHPLRHAIFVRNTNRSAVNIMIWVFAVVASVPTLWAITSAERNTRSLNNTEEHILCLDAFNINSSAEKMIALLDLVIFYVIPMAIILESSLTILKHLWFTKCDLQNTNIVLLKSRKRISRILYSIVISFNVCWLPWAIVMGSVFTHMEVVFSYQTFLSIIVLVALNSTMNPLLYAIQSARFRREIKHLLIGRKKP